MRKLIAASIFIAAFYCAEVHAIERVILTCSSERVVGYQADSWVPNIFDSRVSARIIETPEGFWTVQVLYNDWQSISSEKPTDEMWFTPEPWQAGRYFALNVTNLRFSYTNTLGYMSPSAGGSAHMAVGTCTRQGG